MATTAPAAMPPTIHMSTQHPSGVVVSTPASFVVTLQHFSQKLHETDSLLDPPFGQVTAAVTTNRALAKRTEMR